MAKLSARGRKELMRVSHRRTINDDEWPEWEASTRTRAYLSDGRILQKHMAEYKDPSGQKRKHSGGWKLLPTVFNECDVAGLRKLRDRYKASGWKVEKFSPEG